MQQGAFGRGGERKIELAGSGLPRQEFLDQQGLMSQLLCGLGFDQRGHLVTEGEQAARLQANDGNAACDKRRKRSQSALKLAPGFIDLADSEERAAAAERASAIDRSGNMHVIAPARQDAACRFKVLAFEIVIERIGE